MAKYNKLDYVGILELGRNQRNRLINKSHMLKIASVLPKKIDVMAPIIVNLTTMNILDGQHRVEAFKYCIDKGTLPKNATLDVMYVEIPPDEEIFAIIEYNINNKNWSLNDYIYNYAVNGNEYYLKLHDWCMTHSLANNGKSPKYRYGAAIIKGKNCSKSLKDGSFSFTEEEFVEADRIHNELCKVLNILLVDKIGPSLEGLAKAWKNYSYISKCDWESELEKEKYLKMAHSTSSEWEVLIRTLFNNLN